MKKGLFIFLTLLSFSSMRAEYGGWFLRILMETNQDKVVNGYVYVASAYFEQDSTQSQHYLLWSLDQLDYDFNDSIEYFKKLIAYPYYQIDAEEKGLVYSIVDETAIAISEISHIEVLEYIPQSYLIGISFPHEQEDMEWMSKPPLDVYNEGGYFCDWQILLHETDERVMMILKELETYNEAFEAQRSELEEIMKYSDGEDYYQTEGELRELEERLDEDKFNILHQFNDMRVVVISFCSC